MSREIQKEHLLTDEEFDALFYSAQHSIHEYKLRLNNNWGDVASQRDWIKILKSSIQKLQYYKEKQEQEEEKKCPCTNNCFDCWCKCHEKEEA